MIYRFVADERLDQFTRVMVGKLAGWRFHKVTRRLDESAPNPTIEGQPRATNRIDDHARGVRRIPDFEL